MRFNGLSGFELADPQDPDSGSLVDRCASDSRIAYPSILRPEKIRKVRHSKKVSKFEFQTDHNFDRESV